MAEIVLRQRWQTHEALGETVRRPRGIVQRLQRQRCCTLAGKYLFYSNADLDKQNTWSRWWSFLECLCLVLHVAATTYLCMAQTCSVANWDRGNIGGAIGVAKSTFCCIENIVSVYSGSSQEN